MASPANHTVQPTHPIQGRVHPTPVRVLIWADTEEDRRNAVANAEWATLGGRWRITGFDPADGPERIRRDDPAALAVNVYYGWAWAAYPATVGAA